MMRRKEVHFFCGTWKRKGEEPNSRCVWRFDQDLQIIGDDDSQNSVEPPEAPAGEVAVPRKKRMAKRRNQRLFFYPQFSPKSIHLC